MRPLLTEILRILQRLLHWWLGELKALVPLRLHAVFGPRSDVILVDAASPDGSEIAVTRLRADGRRQHVARLPPPPPSSPSGQGGDAGAAAEPPAALRGVLSALRGAEVVLRLPADAALRKPVGLPMAAAANLHEILYFELDRQTPFRPDEVYFDHRVIDRRPEAQRLLVELTVLARAGVDPLLAWLARFGLEPDRLEGRAADADADAEGGGPGTAGWTCRLPTPEENDPAAAGGGGAARRPAAVARFLNPALAALALVLAGAAVYVPLARQQAELADLQADLARERRAAEATLELRETAAALGREALHLVNKKRATPSVLEALNEITRVLPDNSYAAELRLQGRQVELVGQSAAATGLLDVFERSELFQRATFRSPITRGRGGEAAERFHLAFELVERGGGPTTAAAAAVVGGEPEPRREAAR